MPQVEIVISKRDDSFESALTGENKFYADTFIYDDEKYHILMKGVNYTFKSDNKDINIHHIISEYEIKGDAFLRDCRGSFAGALYDKLRMRWLVFTNHFGDQQLFYAETDEHIFISSSIFKVAEKLKLYKRNITLDNESVYQLLSYGYMCGNRTLVNEIKKVEAGQYLKITGGAIFKEVFYSIDNTPDHTMTEDAFVEGIDHYFRNAVKYEFEKDILYGFKHLVTLSGGFDSRMTVWVANDLGYKDITTVTISQSGYLEVKIAKEVSEYLKTRWLFAALDGGGHLTDIIEEITFRSNALYHFSGASALAMINKFSDKNSGLIHTGLLGDVIVGTYTPAGAYDRPRSVKSTSGRLTGRFKQDELHKYKNNETATFYVRGINGILVNNSVLQEKSEVASPFLDVDFFNFCMSIPVKYRAYHRIYKKWVLSKYPDATRFKWEKIRAKITDRSLVIRNKIVPVRHLDRFMIEGICHNLGMPIHNTYSKSHMNPYNYWYKTNESLRDYLQDYYRNFIDLITDATLKKDCEDMFTRGDAVEKMQVITILSAVKQFLPDGRLEGHAIKKSD